MNNNSICYCGSQCEDDKVFCNDCLNIPCDDCIETEMVCDGGCESVPYIVNK
jgi:hypothetical protein